MDEQAGNKIYASVGKICTAFMFHEFEVVLWSCLVSATLLVELEAKVDG